MILWNKDLVLILINLIFALDIKKYNTMQESHGIIKGEIIALIIIIN